MSLVARTANMQLEVDAGTFPYGNCRCLNGHFHVADYETSGGPST
jgi:hypothetical protein